MTNRTVGRMISPIMETTRAPSDPGPVAESVQGSGSSGPTRVPPRPTVVPTRPAGAPARSVGVSERLAGAAPGATDAGRPDPSSVLVPGLRDLGVGGRPDDASVAERRMRLAVEAATGLVLGLAALLVVRLFVPGAGLVDVVALLGVAALALAVALSSRSFGIVLQERAEHEETLTRLLRGLSRTLSSDAAVTAIVDELRRGAGADHVVVVLLKPAEAIVEATLVSTSTSIPMSVTRFPATELDPISTEGSGAVGIGRSGPRHLGREGAPPRRVQAVPIPERSGRNGGWGQDRPADASEFSRPAVELVAVPVITEHDTRGDPFAEFMPVRDAMRVSMPGDRPSSAVPRPGLPGADEDKSAASPTPPYPDVPPGDVTIVDRLADRVCRAYGLRHVLVAPIRSDGRVVGALVLSRRVESPWSGPTRRLLESGALEVSAALARAHAYEAVEARATTDALTGLPNRAYFEELIGLLGRGRRAGDALGILMIDIDHFKKLNDRYGHAVGDAVLRGVGWTLRATVRAGDVPARYGGEEFVVVLRHASPERAVEIAERIRYAIRDLDPAAFGIADPVTVSIGVAVAAATPPRALVERADAALYVAKRGGRDRVAVA
jgi:diguanylate cyclase (GGDEF)-like protein